MDAGLHEAYLIQPDGVKPTRLPRQRHRFCSQDQFVGTLAGSTLTVRADVELVYRRQ